MTPLTKNQKVAIGVGAAAGVGGLILAFAGRKGGGGNGGFTGCSLMVTNPPAGTEYWSIEYGFFEMDEAAWWWELPSPQTLYINCLKLEGGEYVLTGEYEYYFKPEAGQHYILDLSTLEEIVNPDPPEPPPEDEGEPYLISADAPSGGAKDDPVAISCRAYLPKVWKNINPYYSIQFILYGLPNGNTATVTSGVVFYSFDPPDDYEPDYYLDAEDNKYDFVAEGDVPAMYYQGARHLPIPVGTYDLKCVIRVGHLLDNGDHGTPYQGYVFDIGPFEVTE